MPRYRLHRLKETQQEHFRWSAHTGGLAMVRPRDYEAGAEVESQTPYSLWKELQSPQSPNCERPLSPGDIVEVVEPSQAGRLFIAKYIGFEPAQWFIAEPKPIEGPMQPPDSPSSEQHADTLSH